MVRQYRTKARRAKSRAITAGIKRVIAQTAYQRRYTHSYMNSKLNPLPTKTTVSLRYVEGIDLAPGAAGAPAKYVWRCNGPYDPNYTGVGHQPMFWDMYAGLYNHCVVSSAKMSVKVWGENNATTYGSIVAVKLDDDGTSSQNVGSILEQRDPYVKWAMMKTNSGGSNNIANLSHSFNARTFFNCKDVGDKDSIGALTNTTPSEQAYWVLLWQHIDASTTFTGNLKGVITIDYVCEFTEARDQSPS